MRKNHTKQLEYQRNWYSRNKDKQKTWVRNRKIKLMQWLSSYKSNLACTVCGENHPACIDFHHKDSDEKEANIGSVINLGWSKERILSEIDKCIILCSNCHRKHHWAEQVSPTGFEPVTLSLEG